MWIAWLRVRFPRRESRCTVRPAEVISIGAGGSLTLRFDSPIANSPSNRFGIDFIIFGNTGFIVTNEDFGCEGRKSA